MGLKDVPSRMIDLRGTLVTLRRDTAAAGANSWTEGATTPAYYTATGYMRQFAPREIQGSIKSGDRIVLLKPDFPVRPQEGDRIALGTITVDNDATAEWYKVVDPNQPMIGGAVAVYRLHVRG